MQAVGQSRGGDEVVDRRVRHDVERLDETAGDQLLMVREHRRTVAEETLDDVGRLLGGADARVAYGE